MLVDTRVLADGDAESKSIDIEHDREGAGNKPLTLCFAQPHLAVQHSRATRVECEDRDVLALIVSRWRSRECNRPRRCARVDDGPKAIIVRMDGGRIEHVTRE